MSQGDIDRFKSAVLEVEQSGELDALIALFDASATLDSPAHDEPLIGREGAAEFWTNYVEVFKAVRSTFTATHTLGDTAVLEWKSEGTLPTGRPVIYRGVSIVKFAGGKIMSFTAYYDSAQFLLEAGTAVQVYEAGALNNEGGD